MAENNKILIASDDESFFKPCVSFFEGLGIEVLLQEDGLSSLNIVKKEPFEFIIAQTDLTYLDGMHLCKIVKSDSRLNHVPFALILESDKPEDMLNARRVGADYSVTKPVDLNVLKDNIINLLYSKQPVDDLE